jgi:hypothetical protein
MKVGAAGENNRDKTQAKERPTLAKTARMGHPSRFSVLGGFNVSN